MNSSTSHLSYIGLSDSTEILSVAEAATYLGVGKNRVYELLKNKSIKGFRMGSIWKICIFREICASVPKERSAIPLETEQRSVG